LDYSAKNTWCGYEISGIILLYNIKGAMQLDHSKDMSVHISTGTTYELSHHKMSDWFLEQ